MKKLFTLAISIFVAAQAFSQCAGGRFQNEIFPGFFDGAFPSLPSAVVYGSNNNYQGANESLDMYVFEPEGDTMAHRPLVILAFGGSFISGFKESPDVLKLCNAYVKRGYVAVSIKYRIGADPIDSLNMMKAVLRGMQDMKGCIRFFYKDAATSNTYRIDTNNIFVGGVSAGAFVGIHAAYLNDMSELQPWIAQAADSIGGLEGNSGNPGYSTQVKGVINLCGAIGDTLWMQPGDPGILSMHGTDDGTVPYGSAIINVSGVNIIEVDGSYSLDIRAENLGLVHSFHTWNGADHVPFVNYIIPGSEGAQYLDSTINFTSDFLFEQVCGEVGIHGPNKENSIKAYPNPSQSSMVIETGFLGFTAETFDVTGKKLKTLAASGSRMVLSKEDFGSGLFLVKISSGNNTITKRIIFE